jgi:hypothetical protein
MIRFFIPTQNKSLDLTTNLEIPFVEENSIFSEDQTPAPFSLGFDIPSTKNNLLIFGYPNRVASVSYIQKTECILMYGSMIYATGELFLIETTNMLKVQFVGYNKDFIEDKLLSEMDLGKYELGRFIKGGNWPFINDFFQEDTDLYRNNIEAATIPGLFSFAVAPVRFKEQNWEGPLVKWGAYNAVRMYANMVNVKHTYAELFGPYEDPGDAYTKTRIAPILPFPYLKDVLDKIFNTQVLRNDLSIIPDFDKIVMTTQSHPGYSAKKLVSWLTIQGEPTDHQYIEPLSEDYTIVETIINPLPPRSFYEVIISVNKLMQDYSVSSFINNLLKIFGANMVSNGEKFDIISETSILNDESDIFPIEKYVIGTPTITDEPLKNFIFEYSDTKTYEDNNSRLVPTIFAARNDLIDNAQYNQATNYEIEADNSILALTKKLFGIDNQFWMDQEIKRSALATNQEQTSAEEFKVTSEVKPLEMSFERYWHKNDNGSNEILQKIWHVPVIEKLDKTAAPNIMLFAGEVRTMADDDGRYPLLTNHNIDHFGNERLDFSLLPNGEKGIINMFHSEKKDWLGKAKKNVRLIAKLDIVQNKKINTKTKIYYKGRLFLIRKKEYNLTHNGISLVEFDLVER